MSLHPRMTLTTPRITLALGAHSLRLEIAGLPAGSHARFRLPTQQAEHLEVGDQASLALTGEKQSVTVLEGTIDQLRRGLSDVSLVLVDDGLRLGRLRTMKTFEGLQTADILTALAKEAGMKFARLLGSLPLPYYVVHQGRTIAEHMHWLAEHSNHLIHVDHTGTLQTSPREATGTAAALAYGRDLIELETRQVPESQSIVWIGNGGNGSSSPPNDLAVSPLTIPEDGGASDQIRLPTAALRSQAAVSLTTTHRAAAAQAASSAFWARCWLKPELRLGQVLDIVDGPSSSNGPWFIDRLIHDLDHRGGSTQIFAGSLPAPGSAGLLGSLLGSFGL